MPTPRFWFERMTTNNHNHIRIKGIPDGLLVLLGDGPLAEIRQELQAELNAKQDFLQGSQVTLQVGTRPLLPAELADLQTIFEDHALTLWTVLADTASARAAARELGLAIRLPGSHTDLEGNALPVNPAISAKMVDQTLPDGLLLKETLRSGRSVYHEGHVVIIGDVNPGAEIVATGDVLVWGRLRGLVHAGATGTETAVICALELTPTQLRIASKIAIPPDSKQQKPVPEMAVIRDGQIIAEPWG